MENFLQQHIGALIFASAQPIPVSEIKTALDEALQSDIPEADVLEAIGLLTDMYKADAHFFELVEIAGGYQFLTKGAYHHIVGIHLKQTTKKRLSQAAMETLAIVAYKQPVSKSELEAIRGVSCDYAVQKLLEKELVEISGRSDGPGKPLLYSTTAKFMDYMGIRSLDDLPKPKDFKEPESEMGTIKED